MEFVKAIIGALIGAILGLVIWLGVSYFTGSSSVYFALAVGGLAGLGTRLICGEEELSIPTGAIAVAVTAAGILYAYSAITTGGDINKIANEISRDNAIALIADGLLEEISNKGQEIKNSDNDSEDEVAAKYPQAIWNVAVSMWDDFSTEEQADFRLDAVAADETLTAPKSFGILGWVFSALGLAAAWMLGYAYGDWEYIDDEDEEDEIDTNLRPVEGMRELAGV